MKVNTKRTYCPNCQKLIMGRSKTSGDIIDVYCPLCNEVIWHWDSIKWLQLKKD